MLGRGPARGLGLGVGLSVWPVLAVPGTGLPSRAGLPAGLGLPAWPDVPTTLAVV